MEKIILGADADGKFSTATMLDTKFGVTTDQYKTDLAQFIVDGSMPKNTNEAYGKFVKDVGTELLKSNNLNTKTERESSPD